ncbi:hypothetical protein GE09DRAFT_729170 [Coniochaeta sp. 2T2.1]|nr:hypothetical protein GE09DRAFT_729170 [Coniochaeta sp. 2T2.1]
MVHLPPKPSIPLVLLFASFLHPSTALPQQPPPGAAIQDQTAQVSINSPDTNPSSSSSLPITLTIFSSSPGPKLCRGHAIASLNIPPPEGLGLTTQSQCYNLPAPAGCGTFVANKEDGCEVRLFAGRDCVEFVNLAVFMPEVRPVGGRWRSFEVRCGVEPPDEGALGRPPLEGMIEGIKRPQRR